MKNDINNPDELKNYQCRESLLNHNAELLSDIKKKIGLKRFKVSEGDGVKLAYMRVYVQAIQAQASILKDLELNDLKVELEELKELIKCQSKP